MSLVTNHPRTTRHRIVGAAYRAGAMVLAGGGLVLVGGCGATSSAPTQAASHTQSATTATVSRAAPNPHSKPAFVRTGHTEQGDSVRIEGHFGPILPPSESDVDQTMLRSCPDAGDGRELVRRLDISLTLTSSLSGEVRLSFFPVAVDEQSEQAHFILDFVLNSPGSTGCYRDLAEGEGGGVVDLGSVPPGVTRRVSTWIVLPDAITPNNPEPTAKELANQEWYFGYPAVSVNGALASTGGGTLEVTR